MIAARFIVLVIGYLLGTFQTGYLYGKSKGIDIRKHGSGNSGTTNTLRTLGWKAGVVTFAGDLLKAILAVAIAHLLYQGSCPDGVKVLELYAGFGAVLGHNFPFYLKFKGGKGIACTAGVILVVCPQAVPVCLSLFLILVVATRYVSLGSICMLIAFVVQVILFNHMGIIHIGADWVVEFDVLTICFAAMGIWRHRANIVRLLHGTENKFGQKAK